MLYFLLMLRLPWMQKKVQKKELFEEDRKARKVEGMESLKASRLASISLEKCQELVSSFPERKAGSEETRKCARRLLEFFSPYSDDCIITSEKASCSGYYGVFRLISSSAVAMLVFSWIGFPSVSLLCALLTVLFSVNEFFLCKGKNKSFLSFSDLTNVHALINPEGDAEKTVIFSAHHDSAPAMNVPANDRNSLIFSMYLPLIHFILLCLTVFCYTVSDVIEGKFLSFNLPPLAIGIFLVILTLSSPLYYRLFTLVSSHYVPGAGDNLISSCILTELAHYFHWKKENGEGLEDTRLVFASFDGEECGLKGSAAWYDSHRDLCRNAVNINIDCPIRSQDMSFLTKDVNGFVPLSSSLASEAAAIAASMGYEVKVGSLSVFSGATDAASAQRAGVDATTLMGVSLSGRDSVIHTDDDTVANLDRKTIEEVISICIKIVETIGRSKVKEEVRPTALEDKSRKFIVN